MKITSAKFLISSARLSQCPSDHLPEYAFIGRSNVGKSSLINMLCQQSALAKVSAKPGKTQLINHFLINNNWYLVDLPGYGYAKVSKSKREEFDKMISSYILGRKNLQCVFVLVDIRIKPQELDINFMENLAESGVPFVIVFTKSDKLSSNARKAQVEAYKSTMLEEWEEFPAYFVTSSETKSGRTELLQFIEETNQLWYKNRK
ncbi:MAG: ribosome biogenesis GTP-binding protein YihA/YsxC [Bacteroidia bacterium]